MSPTKRLVFVLLCVAWLHPARGAVNLDYATVHASGAGNTVTTGTVAFHSPTLNVASASTWLAFHGIRVRRAGLPALVSHADSGWSSANAAVAVDHPFDAARGSNVVRCTHNNTVTSQPYFCETGLPNGFDANSDEVGLFIQSSVKLEPGDFQLEYRDAGGDSKLQMPVPAVDPGVWTEVYVRVEARRTPSDNDPVGRISLRCLRTNCRNISVRMDELIKVNDYVGRVIQTNGTQFTLDHQVERGVTGAEVFHDDTEAVRNWLAASPGTLHTAPAGVFYLSRTEIPTGPGTPIGIPSFTTMSCAGRSVTTFKNSGWSHSGLHTMLLASAMPGTPAPRDITIEHCGFDMGGYNWTNFSDTIAILGKVQPDSCNPLVETCDKALNITIRDNSVTDSLYLADPVGRKGNCDISGNECVTRQRHAIIVLRVMNLTIEDNFVSGGGRIKAGGPGINMSIRRNTVDFINDNGITIATSRPGPPFSCDPASMPPENRVACATQHVWITDNIVNDACGAGIFIGADGESSDDPHMELSDVTVANNTVTGFFTLGITGILPSGVTDFIHVQDNFVAASRNRKQVPEGYTAGINLAHSDTSLVAADHFDVLRNRVRVVSTAGPFAFYNVAGIHLGAPFNHLSVDGNQIDCDTCTVGDQRLNVGLLFKGAAGAGLDNTTISNNTIESAGTAFRLPVAATGLRLIANGFFYSFNSVEGQVTLLPPGGAAISADVFGNFFEHGLGFGLQCSGGTHVNSDVHDPTVNTFLDNARGDISGSCF